MLITILCTNSTTMTSLAHKILRMFYSEVYLVMDNSLVQLPHLDHRISAMLRRLLRLVEQFSVHLRDDKIILQGNILCKVKHRVDVVKKRAKI
jgi:hypothetical protein